MLHLLVALSSPSPSPLMSQSLPVDTSKVTPGFLGPLVFLSLVGAAVFLFRSLRKQLGRVPESFGDKSAGA
ncbi:MAG: hypothetical protein WCJ42_10780 [Actinomycetes bacterium]